MRDRFAGGRRAVVVTGPPGSGKTTLLAEFVYSQPDACFSFFIGSDIWGSHPRTYLFDMCQQMRAFLQQPALRENISQDRLEQDFATLLLQVFRRSRDAHLAIYFVLDGIDKARDFPHCKSLFELVPKDLRRRVYFLGSCTDDPREEMGGLEYELWTLPPFSLADSRMLIGDLEVSPEQALKAHEVSRGLPGYMAHLRRKLVAGESAAEIFADLPSALEQLIEREWQRDVVTLGMAIRPWLQVRVSSHAGERLIASTFALGGPDPDHDG